MQRLLELIKKILPWLVQVTGVQIQQRLSPNLRASLFGGCILIISIALYLGWISATTAGLLWTNVVALFNWDIVKKAPGSATAISMQQVPTVVRLPSVESANAANETKSVLQDRLSVNIPVIDQTETVAFRAQTPLVNTGVVELGPEFTKEQK